MAKNDNRINENDERINERLNENNEKFNGIQNIVIALSETVKTVEIKVSKHDTEILEFKAKVSYQERRVWKVD